jgi:hypothetical protein
MARTKAKAKYRTKDGLIVPGVTTILGILAKPALVPWANKLGLQGIEVGKYVDDKADIGTLAHAMILSHLKGEKTDTSDYSQKQIDQAENSFLSYLEWERGKKIEPVFVESSFVSEDCLFGGQPDFYGRVDGRRTILDFKTGSGIYDEHYFQLCAYESLLKEQGCDAERGIILNIPRTEDERFSEKTFYDFENGWRLFVHCLEIYNLKKKIGRI